GPEGGLLTDEGRVEDRIDAGSPRLRLDGTAVEEGEDDLQEALVPDTATLREQLPTEVDRLDGSVPVPQPLGDDEAGDGHVGEGTERGLALGLPLVGQAERFQLVEAAQDGRGLTRLGGEPDPGVRFGEHLVEGVDPEPLRSANGVVRDRFGGDRGSVHRTRLRASAGAVVHPAHLVRDACGLIAPGVASDVLLPRAQCGGRGPEAKTPIAYTGEGLTGIGW